MGDGGALPDGEILWRRVPRAEQLPPDEGRPAIVPKGSAFRTKGTEDGVSVGLASAFRADEKGPEAMLDRPECDATWGVLETTAGEVRAIEGLDVIVDPEDVSHGLIIPPPSSGKARKISKGARWAVYPQWP